MIGKTKGRKAFVLAATSSWCREDGLCLRWLGGGADSWCCTHLKISFSSLNSIVPLPLQSKVQVFIQEGTPSMTCF